MKKSNPSADEISALVNEISQFVDDIIYESQGTMDTAPLSPERLDEADEVLAILTDIRSELLDLSDDILDRPDDKQISKSLANSSYEVAKVLIANVAC